MIKGCALVLLRRVEEGKKILEQFRSRRLSDGTLHTLTMVDGAHSVARILEGKLGEGVRSLKKLIKSREGEGYVAIADWYRQLLSEVYLTVIEGREQPPFSVILKNLPVILKIIIAGPAEIENLLAPVRANLRYDLNGYAIGRCEMTLGLLYKAKKKRALAVQI
jgi:hypothetical protein